MGLWLHWPSQCRCAEPGTCAINTCAVQSLLGLSPATWDVLCSDFEHEGCRPVRYTCPIKRKVATRAERLLTGRPPKKTQWPLAVLCREAAGCYSQASGRFSTNRGLRYVAGVLTLILLPVCAQTSQMTPNSKSSPVGTEDGFPLGTKTARTRGLHISSVLGEMNVATRRCCSCCVVESWPPTSRFMDRNFKAIV